MKTVINIHPAIETFLKRLIGAMVPVIPGVKRNTARGSVEQRMNEAVRLGFRRVALPKRCASRAGELPADTALIPLSGIYDALRLFREQEKTEGKKE